jgi:hypothetical protein
MYRVKLPQPGEYHNLDLTQNQFVDIVTGADTELGIAVWNPETLDYVSDVTAEQAVQLYPVCWREIYP